MADDNPIRQAFDLQRQALERSQDAMKQGLEFQQELNEALLSGIDQGTETGERGTELTREAVHSALDAIEELLPEDQVEFGQVREAVDQQFEAAGDATERAGEQAREFTETGIESAEQAAETYVDSVDEQLDALLSAHEDLEEQTQSFIEETEAQIEELQEQTGVPVEGIDQLRERMDELADRLE